MSTLLTTPFQTTTWSYQLQFNFKFKKSNTPFTLLNPRFSTLTNYRRNLLLLHCIAQENEANSNGNNSERRRSEDSWDTKSSSIDATLSDWLGNSDDSTDSGNKNGIAGILGAGLAGVLLVAGITSAAISIGKRNSSKSIPEMKPVTEHQEVLLTSEEEVYGEEGNKNDGQYSAQDENNLQNGQFLESDTGRNSELSSSLETTEFVSQTVLVDDTNVETLSGIENSTSVGFDASAQESIQTSPELSQIENIDGDYVSSSSVEMQNNSVISNAESGIGLLSTNVQEETLTSDQTYSSSTALESSSSIVMHTDLQNVDSSGAATADLETDNVLSNDVPGVVTSEDNEVQKPLQFSGESNFTPIGDVEAVDEQDRGSDVGDRSAGNVYSSRGIPAPSLISAALQVPPGKILVPAVTDQTQSQALTALQVMKVIESDAQPGDLCTRREYARWLVSASSALSRNLILKVYPAMYIENFTDLAFDDITPEDPDFTSIQGLAEAGLISSKLSRRDMLSSPDEDIGSYYFHPDSPLSRQDLVTWKMALEKKQLPEADRKTLHQLSGFIDIDRINPDACPALVADLSAEQGIVALAFGYTRLFQPDKPVTKGQAAIAIATGEAADVVSEELARIEAESIADKAVATHNELVAEVEKDINANFETELLMEREKIDAVQKMAEEAKQEVERLRAEREEKNIALMKERAAIESEMEVLSRLRHELEEQLQSVMGNKVEISYEKERIEKLKKETEEENQAIVRLQYELEVERKALSMARSWAEDEAKRVQDHAKALEEARDRWERKGLKVMVDEDLREEASADITWTNVGKQLDVEETADRAENLMDKLKVMANEVSGKSKEIINKIIQKIQSLISAIKEWISEAGKRTTEIGDVAVAKVGGSVQELQQNAAGFVTTVKEGAKRVVEDCREGVEKLTQRFNKT